MTAVAQRVRPAKSVLTWLRHVAAWIMAGLVVVWRWTCRIRFENDPRPALRAAGTPYVMALLHAHQVAAVLGNDEVQLAAMVSRSADGDLLVPSLRVRGVQPVRGSSRSGGRDKGGAAALLRLTHLTQQGVPALLAVDGPRGPRNAVHLGIARLARRTDAVVLPVVALASRRWFLPRTWDRMQFPKPFSRVRIIFGAPIAPGGYADDEPLRADVEVALADLERHSDPREAPLPPAQP